MRWKKKLPLYRWRTWFAWYPIRTDSEVIWLEKCQRFETGSGWEYRSLMKATQEAMEEAVSGSDPEAAQ